MGFGHGMGRKRAVKRSVHGGVTIENVEEHAGVLTNKFKHCMGGGDAPEAYSSPGPYYITTPKGRIAK